MLNWTYFFNGEWNNKAQLSTRQVTWSITSLDCTLCWHHSVRSMTRWAETGGFVPSILLMLWAAETASITRWTFVCALDLAAVITARAPAGTLSQSMCNRNSSWDHWPLPLQLACKRSLVLAGCILFLLQDREILILGSSHSRLLNCHSTTLAPLLPGEKDEPGSRNPNDSRLCFCLPASGGGRQERHREW